MRPRDFRDPIDSIKAKAWVSVALRLEDVEAIKKIALKYKRYALKYDAPVITIKHSKKGRRGT